MSEFRNCTSCKSREKRNIGCKPMRNFDFCNGYEPDKVIYLSTLENLKRENKLLVEKLEQWEMMFKHGLNHLNNKIVWDISPTSQIHNFLKKQLEG